MPDPARAVEDAIKELTSDSPHVRLKAARVLSRFGSAACAHEIRVALRREPVSWVRRALESALAKHAVPDPTTEHDEQGAATQRDIRSAAVYEVTRTFLHEFEPIVGPLKVRAMREVRAYETSEVKKSIERLDQLLDAFRSMSQAAAIPANKEMELTAFIREVVAEQANAETISLFGPTPLLVDADRGKLRLAFENGLRNAIEAVASTPSAAPLSGSPHVTVLWGETDVEVWIAVNDEGPGFNGAPAARFDIGSSTKDGHLGMGLAIAKQAMDSMEGTVSLSPRTTGARFEMRWYKGRNK